MVITAASDPKYVAKKQQLEAVKDVIMVDYSLPTNGQNQATCLGWIGKCIAEMPQHALSYMELIDDYKMMYFLWDGL